MLISGKGVGEVKIKFSTGRSSGTGRSEPWEPNKAFGISGTSRGTPVRAAGRPYELQKAPVNHRAWYFPTTDSRGRHLARLVENAPHVQGFSPCYRGPGLIPAHGPFPLSPPFHVYFTFSLIKAKSPKKYLRKTNNSPTVCQRK